MSPQQATAEVFMTALKALPRKEQDIFLSHLVEDKAFHEDLIDIIISVKRGREKGGKPFRNILATLKNAHS